MKQKIIISGVAKGSGKDRFRWVSFLCEAAKEALKNNRALVICERNFNDNLGKWYVVTENKGRYNHRLPTEDERKMIEDLL